MAKREVWITTIDNPYDPFTQMEVWKRFDEDHGYNTVPLLCRYMKDSNDLGEQDYEEAVEEAVDIMMRFNFYGNYRKLVKEGDEIHYE